MSVKDSGREFVFVKASQGTDIADGCNHSLSGCPPSDHTDSNIQNALDAHLLVSPYHLAGDENGVLGDPIKEAQYFLDRAGNYVVNGNLPPALDLEGMYHLNGQQLSQWVRTWLQYIQNQKVGVTPIVYAARCDLESLDIDIQTYPLWIADWDCDGMSTPVAPSKCVAKSWPSWRFKQYNDGADDGGCGALCPGINGGVDLDSFNGDLSTLRALVNDHVTSAAQYTVIPNADPNGNIIPSIPQKVLSLGGVTFTASPATTLAATKSAVTMDAATGFVVDQWLVNGLAAQSSGTNFTLLNVTADTGVQVTFKPVPPGGFHCDTKRRGEWEH